MKKQLIRHFVTYSVGLSLALLPSLAVAQGTNISAPRNSYTVADDVKVGRQAAAEVRQKLPLLPESGEVDAYVERVGRRLVAALPRQFSQAQFQYSFDVVNAREINAFALPGGPMFVNRGMIQAARTEGEMAGVMAHEISHVALRHGTAQASKTQRLQLPALGGAILGAIIGGNLGGIISQGTQMGLGVYALKYSREYETQADLLGAQILANAGYDPRDLANMFRTIERQGGGSGPEWLSSHPNPGNRYERINQEASRLRVNRARGSDGEFNRVRSLLGQMSTAPTMEEIARNQPRSSQGRQYPADSRIEQNVEAPAARYRTYNGGNVFRLVVPENWGEFGSGNSEVTFAPRGAYGNYRNQTVFTHGVIAGLATPQSRDLQQASAAYINALLQSNPYLRSRSGYQRIRLGNAAALSQSFTGQSPVTGRSEIVTIHTALARNGALFYVITVAPRDELATYNQVFQNILRSLALN
jgi:beta-barrel assembly-enhancing protease